MNLTLFTPAVELCDTTKTGQELAEQGMLIAEQHANQVHPNWSEKAFEWFLKYIQLNGLKHQFKTEDVRAYAEANGFEAPPSLRAWGSIVVKVAKAGFIKSAGYIKVENAKAHSTPATLWKVVSLNCETKKVA